MDIYFLKFQECSLTQLSDAYALRQRVFVIEQQCFYEDIDGYDPKAHHLFLYDGDVLCAYLRYFEPGIKYKEGSLGRIIVEKEYRGKEVGSVLIKTGIDKARELTPGTSIRIEAQAPLTEYYSQYGFIPVSDVYKVDGIDHLQMLLE